MHGIATGSFFHGLLHFGVELPITGYQDTELHASNYIAKCEFQQNRDVKTERCCSCSSM